MWQCRNNNRREEDCDSTKHIAALEADYKTRTSQLSEVTLRMRELKAENAALCETNVKLGATLSAAWAKNTELRKDAARYRWLRWKDWFDSPLAVLADPKRVLTQGVGLGADCPSRDRLDAAIDAAMGEQK
jgi:hypothetical protein